MDKLYIDPKFDGKWIAIKSFNDHTVIASNNGIDGLLVSLKANMTLTRETVILFHALQTSPKSIYDLGEFNDADILFEAIPNNKFGGNDEDN